MNGYNPKVSIVIPAYNASNYLAEAIDSALAQTYKNIEIIVVNDGSKDDGATAAVAAKYGDKIRYYEKENGGSSSALNTGIKNMTGEWFSWLSHDDLYLPNKVEEQIKYINSLGLSEEQLENNVFFAACRHIDGDGKVIRQRKESEIRAIYDTICSLPGNEYLVAEPTRYIFHGCTCLVHKKVFDAIGCFDEKLRYLNDVDLWFRVYSQGYKVNYIPKILVSGRIHSKQVSKTIGFSYNNPEQDMFWARSLKWLSDNHPDKYELFYLFGRNAYLKSRFSDGDNAFAVAGRLKPNKKFALSLKRVMYKTRANLWSLMKTVYLKIKT